MSFSDQPLNKRFAIFRKSLRAYEASLGVFVQTIKSAQLAQLLSDGADRNDPVVKALRQLNVHFADCKQQDVDMAGCVQSLLLEHQRSKREDGAVMIAWSQTHDGRALSAMRPVGVVTVHNFVESDNFSTTPEKLSASDFATLSRYFGSSYLYIDCMCSTQRGVGRLLLQSAFAYAIQRKKTGVLALAFAQRANSTPQAAAAFDRCKFSKLIPRADFRVRMYGTWYLKLVKDVSLDGLSPDAVAVCTRTGLTQRTADSLVWRCP